MSSENEAAEKRVGELSAPIWDEEDEELLNGERNHLVAALTRNAELELQVAELQARVDALGWKTITPETKWEEGSELGWWNWAKTDWNIWLWYEDQTAARMLHIGRSHYRRSNTPPQEPKP